MASPIEQDRQALGQLCALLVSALNDVGYTFRTEAGLIYVTGLEEAVSIAFEDTCSIGESDIPALLESLKIVAGALRERSKVNRSLTEVWALRERNAALRKQALDQG